MTITDPVVIEADRDARRIVGFSDRMMKAMMRTQTLVGEVKATRDPERTRELIEQLLAVREEVRTDVAEFPELNRRYRESAAQARNRDNEHTSYLNWNVDHGPQGFYNAAAWANYVERYAHEILRDEVQVHRFGRYDGSYDDEALGRGPTRVGSKDITDPDDYAPFQIKDGRTIVDSRNKNGVPLNWTVTRIVLEALYERNTKGKVVNPTTVAYSVRDPLEGLVTLTIEDPMPKDQRILEGIRQLSLRLGQEKLRTRSHRFDEMGHTDRDRQQLVEYVNLGGGTPEENYLVYNAALRMVMGKARSPFGRGNFSETRKSYAEVENFHLLDPDTSQPEFKVYDASFMPKMLATIRERVGHAGSFARNKCQRQYLTT